MIENDSSHVVLYINIRISSMQFSPCKDILNHKDIYLISFLNNNNIFSLINIYSDLSQIALKYLKNIEAAINNVLIMMGNFNICDNFWDPNYLFHLSHSNLLFDITDSLNLGLLHPINLIPTRYSNNKHDSNLVIDLIFLKYSSEETNNHSIQPDWRFVSDHALLIICIPIFKKFIQTKKHSLVKNSDEEKSFISNLINHLHSINASNLQDIALLENIVCTFALTTNSLWNHYSKMVNITKYSKS